ncbi:Thiol-disulfide oxidoreductase ResA [Botrimarina colliarenosi]|uniref:Thiol-disulfide oxidoreductase ResA n=1 Tax=Botrimarina colliarenosi TaxID=2528001 RepID=A0A5C6AKX9_9BACT|nr:TlpA disulfide reductase family protein [Botrimarina colliarenosi]TWU00117.1 Thiol-disulfide oxidoreductase ResA [Botrimarina colliarenosi]
MRTSLTVAVLLVACTAGLIWAVQSARNPDLTSAEQELVALMTDYYAALEPYWHATSELKSREDYDRAIADSTLVDPSAEYIPRLLDFEADHRGDDVGLLALWHVFKEAGRGGGDDAPEVVGRREALSRLPFYAKSNLLSIAGKVTFYGNYEPAAHDAISSLVASETVPKATRDALRFYLANDDLELEDARVRSVQRVEALRSGAKPYRPGELDLHVEWLAKSPSEAEMAARRDAAVATLEQLVADEASPLIPGTKGVDDRWYVIRIIDDPHPQRFADQAAALLFRERHLKVGVVAPDLEVSLLDGEPWRMADQRGKAVVVQFSFTGCGPCARMYPDLADLTTEYGDRLEILTLMRDATPDSALEGVADGKLTWSVALDGDPGRVAREWSVDGFPEVYVIDQVGKIAAIGLPGEALRDEVARLLNAADGSADVRSR